MQIGHSKATTSQGLFATCIMFSRNPQLVRISENSFNISSNLKSVSLIMVDLNRQTAIACLNIALISPLIISNKLAAHNHF